MKRTLFRKRCRSSPMNMKDIKNKLYSLYQKRLLPNRRFCFLSVPKQVLRIVLVLALFHFSATAQVRKYTDSFKEKKSFYFTWDSKITFISNRYAQVKSLKLGFDFGGKTKFGVGYNWYKGPMVRSFDEQPVNPIPTANLKLRYASLFTEYLYFKNDKWEATIPAQLGMGFLEYRREFTKEKIPGAGGFCLLYEPSSTITYRVLRYFGVGAGIGYRLVLLFGHNPHKENLQSPVIMIRTKIYFDTLMADFKAWRKKKQKD